MTLTYEKMMEIAAAAGKIRLLVLMGQPGKGKGT
jgi:hypothetical protein